MTDRSTNVRGLRRKRSADEVPGARLRHDDATALHELVDAIQMALGDSARYGLVITAGVGVRVVRTRHKPWPLAIAFPLIVQAQRTELLSLLAGAIMDDRAARRPFGRLAFDRLLEPAAAPLLGLEAAAGALLCEDFVEHLLRDEFWPAIWSETATRPEPPADVFERMAAFLQEAPEAPPGTGDALLPPAALTRVAAELSGAWQSSARERWHAARAAAA